MLHTIRGRLILAFIGLAVGSVAVAAAVLIGLGYSPLTRGAGAPSSLAVLVVAGLILVAAAGGAAALLGILSVRRMLQPIESLTEAADAIGEGDLSPRAPVTTDDEFGVLAGTFNHMARRLRERIGTLEQRAAERSKALAAVRDIGRLAAEPDQSAFAAAAAERVRGALNYYHVQIFLPDESGGLILAAATGEPGRKLLAAGCRLRRGEGLPGRAAETNAPALAADVSREPERAANILPVKTKSEAAVPIAIGERVLGVLDAQQVVLGGLTPGDVELLQPIAAQIAAALRSARAPGPAREDAEYEAEISAIGRRIDETATAAEAVRVAERELARALPAREVRVTLSDGGG
jgi:nitrate/nitrite-specific signal transduction histidine kinase